MSTFSSEAKRLEVLHSYEILDTEENREYDNLVKLAAQICEVPIAKINFIDEKRVWSKANYGNDIKESPRELNFCHTTITQDEYMVVEDASKDHRFSHFDFVSGKPGLKFYAGVNIKRNEECLGSLCVLGQEPRKLSDAQLDALRTIASEIETRLELNRKNKELETTAAFLSASVDLLCIVEPETLRVEKMNQHENKVFSGISEKDFLKPLNEVFPGWSYISKLQKNHLEGISSFKTESALYYNEREIHLELNAIKKEGKWLITASDITKRVQAEMELMREKMFTDTIINSLPVNFFMYDEDWNGLRRHTIPTLSSDYEDKEFKKMSPLDFFEGDDLERIKDYIKRTFEEDEPLGSIEADLIRKDGVKEPFLFNAVCFVKDGKKYLIGTSQSIAAQRAYQLQLENLLAEKEVLLAEVHHRVKNNLAVISGFLQMQEFISESEQVKSALLTNHMRVKSMALIHEDLYKVDDFSGIRFDYYLNRLLEYIQQKRSPQGKQIRLEMMIDEVKLNLNQALPLALIINELVSNAYEFAFDGRELGTIWITLRSVGANVFLSVKDDGIGLPQGFDLEESPTLGTTLVLSYSEQINSEIEIKTGPDGTEYTLEFTHQSNSRGSAMNKAI